jgi:hypothetical protein
VEGVNQPLHPRANYFIHHHFILLIFVIFRAALKVFSGANYRELVPIELLPVVSAIAILVPHFILPIIYFNELIINL